MRLISEIEEKRKATKELFQKWRNGLFSPRFRVRNPVFEIVPKPFLAFLSNRWVAEVARDRGSQATRDVGSNPRKSICPGTVPPLF